MLCNGPYTPLKVPLPVAAYAPHLINFYTVCWVQATQRPKRHLGSAVYARLKPERSYTLQWAAHFPLKCRFSWEHACGPPSKLIHGSLGSRERTTQTASRSVQPFLL